MKRIPYGRQWVGREEQKAVLEVLKSDFLTQGPKVSEFERNLAKCIGVPYVVAVSNGTAALHLAALALKLRQGDEVITTPVSFLATSNAILYAGAHPVFADIDPETQCLDPLQLKKKITRKTKAIFVTDFAGHPAEMRTIKQIAMDHDLKVLQDAAHSLGASYSDGRYRSGDCSHSDLAILSFHPVKHITTGEGGAITTKSAQLYEALCDLRTHGVTKNPKRLKLKNQGAWYYEMQSLGFNYRLTDIQAALGIEQLKKLPNFLSRRREIAALYGHYFKDQTHFLLPVEKPKCRHAYHLYILRLSKSLALKRKEIFAALQASGIGVQVHYIPIPAQPFYRQLGYRASDYPKALHFYQSAISLPIYPKMTNREVGIVAKSVLSIIRSFVNND